MGVIRFLHRWGVPQGMPAGAVGYYERLVEPIQEAYLGGFVERASAGRTGAVRALDVGAGCGHLAVLLAGRNPGWRITGVDLSGPSVEASALRAAEAGVADRVEFLRGSVDHPGLAGRTFDLILSSCSLHHWRRPAGILAGAAKLLAAGGEILLLDDRGGAPRKDRREWVRAVEAAHGRRLRLFSLVYGMESRFLAYTESEVARLAVRAGLRLAAWEPMGVFFVARLVPAGAS